MPQSTGTPPRPHQGPRPGGRLFIQVDTGRSPNVLAAESPPHQQLHCLLAGWTIVPGDCAYSPAHQFAGVCRPVAFIRIHGGGYLVPSEPMGGELCPYSVRSLACGSTAPDQTRREPGIVLPTGRSQLLDGRLNFDASGCVITQLATQLRARVLTPCQQVQGSLGRGPCNLWFGSSSH